MHNIISAQCHCGAVQFSVILFDHFNTIRRCNCSFCRMRGAVAVSVNFDDLTILQGKDKLTEYRFNTGTAAHYFCSVCGIYTFHQRRSNPNQYDVNVACLKDTSPFDFEKVPVVDGIHHPKDSGGGTIGYLIFEKK